jgi:hypothetical protein
MALSSKDSESVAWFAPKVFVSERSDTSVFGGREGCTDLLRQTIDDNNGGAPSPGPFCSRMQNRRYSIFCGPRTRA